MLRSIVMDVAAGMVLMNMVFCIQQVRSRPFPDPISVDLRCKSSIEEINSQIEQLLLSKKCYLYTKHHEKTIRIYSDFKYYQGPILGILRKQYEARCKYMVELGKNIGTNTSIDLTVFIVPEIRPDKNHPWIEREYPGRKDDTERLLSEFIQSLKEIGACK
jgi:hypothetical protein